AGLGRQEFILSLNDIGPALQLCGLLDEIWRGPHPHLKELLEAIAQAHPDKQVTKAATRALFKTRSTRGRPVSPRRPRRRSCAPGARPCPGPVPEVAVHRDPHDVLAADGRAPASDAGMRKPSEGSSEGSIT